MDIISMISALYNNKIIMLLAKLFIFSALTYAKATLATFGGLRHFGNLPSDWPQMTPAWHSNPSMRYMSWSMVLSTKSSSHRVFLSDLTPGWPRLTPAWPSTPVMHYSLVRGSSYQIQGISKATWHLDDFWSLVVRFENMLSNRVGGPSPSPMQSFSSILLSTTN